MFFRHIALVFLLTPLFGWGADDAVVVEPRTEQTIQSALRWLARQQQPSGAWTTGGSRRGEHPVAMTGYALVAFMAAGHLPDEGEYGKETAAGVEFLLNSIQPDGRYRDVPGGHYMYDHGIATIALGEIYGQSRNPALREKLERAVKLIVASQAERGAHAGGWRYQPRPGDADVSVTVLQVVALRSARTAGLAVPQETMDAAIGYVKRCQHGSGGFTYQAGGGQPGFARTAAAIYSLQICGLYDDPMVLSGANYILANQAGGRAEHYMYGCNYAGPAFYMIGGDHWRRWYGSQRDQWLASVKREGELAFWEGEVGPVYQTAAAATILALPWHYLPLYQR